MIEVKITMQEFEAWRPDSDSSAPHDLQHAMWVKQRLVDAGIPLTVAFSPLDCKPARGTILMFEDPANHVFVYRWYDAGESRAS